MATSEQEIATIEFNPDEVSRDALLKKLPGLEKVLPDFEKYGGTLINGCCAGRFKDGRFVILLQFEKQYLFVFFNPANPKESREKNVWLSREATMALMGLYQMLENSECDTAAFLEHLEPEESA